jgi:collagenase-like PrtC family protease
MVDVVRPELTLGPVLFLWDADTWRDFYFRIADEAAVDTVVVGEVVCSKRQHFHADVTEAVVERLRSAGKTVRLASLALVTLERERQASRVLAEQAELEIEINELGLLSFLHGRPHAIGPLVNVYNASTARVLAAQGATTICLPPELPLASIATIAPAVPELAFEVFAFGRVPLAISARCAHARIKGRTKDHCQFVCGEDPDGLPVDTLDDQPFLALNGVQTMSSTCQALVGDMPALLRAGVSGFRLSPQRCDMVAVAAVFDAVGRNRMAPEEGMRELAAIYPNQQFSNGFLHGQPGHRLERLPA